MNKFLKKTGYRIYQYSLKAALPLIKYPNQQLYRGTTSLEELSSYIKTLSIMKILIVTDPGLLKLGIIGPLLPHLDEKEISYKIFSDIQANPTIQNIEDGLKIYDSNDCQAVLGFGGGSPMDCAKIIAARVKNRRLDVPAMRGMFKLRRRGVSLFMIPTTAGTGSETTIAAVITDPVSQEKFAVTDPRLMPHAVAIDPALMTALPPHITSTTGMDALTHAVEAYIGLHDFPKIRKASEKAVSLIFSELENVYKEGKNLEGRDKMAMASYYGGYAFTRASVGYVHAIAHNMGGQYGVPHGLANAVILPYVLEYFVEQGGPVIEKLARLARVAHIGSKDDNNEKLAKLFVSEIRAMNKRMNIPLFIKELKEKDIDIICRRALKEGNPFYPVPTIMELADCRNVVERLLIREEVPV